MTRPRPSLADLALIDPDGRFSARLAADREALVRATETGDYRIVQRVAHALAGAAGTFGHDEVGERAMALDDLFRGGTAVAAGGEVERAISALLVVLAPEDRQ